MNSRITRPVLMTNTTSESYTLAQLLGMHQQDNQLLPEDCIIPVAQAILHGLAGLHEKGCIYGPLTPDDIVLMDQSDFQLLVPAWMQESDNKAAWVDTGCVHVAPEALEKGIWTEASDVFCAGIITAQCLLGRHPFQYDASESRDDIQYHIQFQVPFMPNVLPGQSRDKGLFALVLAMLIRDPQSRPTADDLLGTIHKKESRSSFLLPGDLSVAVNK